MKRTSPQLEHTRTAILDALAHVIVQSKSVGFSVQEVANRAGVTHRTVYNHFPTREALIDGLAVYVDQLLATGGTAPHLGATLDTLPSLVDEVYRGLDSQAVYVRAYVMLMVASRAPAQVARDRFRRLEELVAGDGALPAGLSARQVAAAIRMFASSTGWHLLTDQLELSPEDAAATAIWATRTLVDAVHASAESTVPTRRSPVNRRRP